MKHLSYLAAIILLVACNGKPALSEHEVICKISGKGFDAKNIRIHLAWTDFRFDDNYQEIDVKINPSAKEVEEYLMAQQNK